MSEVLCFNRRWSSPVRILVHLDLPNRLERSGIYTAFRQHRKALEGVAKLELVDPPAAGELIRGLLSRHESEIDLIHTHLFGPRSIALSLLARRHDIPLVCHAHVTREDFRGSFRGSNQLAYPLGWYLKRWYSHADLVVVPSDHTRERLEDYPVTAPITVSTNGVDLAGLSGYEALREPYRERYEIEGTAVCCLGNVFQRKGVDTFCAIAEALPDIEFVWFGPYESGVTASKTVKRLVNDPPPNVTFTGWVDDRRGALAAADIFLLPSREENQGIAVLEAMACEVPVILRDLPVFKEFVTDGTDAILASEESAFVDAIEQLANDHELATSIGKAASETAKSHRLEVVADTMIGQYRPLIEGR